MAGQVFSKQRAISTATINPAFGKEKSPGARFLHDPELTKPDRAAMREWRTLDLIYLGDEKVVVLSQDFLKGQARAGGSKHHRSACKNGWSPKRPVAS
jgi:hypothetical protein